MDHFCYACFVRVMLSCLFIAALWSPAGKGLTSCSLVCDVLCVFVTFPCGILGQVWYLIVSIPDLCLLVLWFWARFGATQKKCRISENDVRFMLLFVIYCLNNSIKHSNNFLTVRLKAMLLLWIIFVICVLCLS